MNNPKLYHTSNKLQRAANIQTLDEYTSKIKWRADTDSIMDLGCGDGEMTTIIKKYAKAKNVKIVASDISDVMIRHAEKHFPNHNITFRVLDMEGDLPDELKCTFNHVFSFFAIHYVKNQEHGFRNIYNLLRKGGDCLLIIMKNIPPFYDMYKESACNEKYKPWLKDVNKFISPYYYMEDALAEKNITEWMEKVGFTNIEVQCKKMTHVYQNGTEIKKALKAVDTFNMPMEVFEEFHRDNVALVHEFGLIDKTCSRLEDHDRPLNFTYDFIVIFATKP